MADFSSSRRALSAYKSAWKKRKNRGNCMEATVIHFMGIKQKYEKI
jgi:hypothetical protein